MDIEEKAYKAFKRQRSYKSTDLTPFTNGYVAGTEAMQQELDQLKAENEWISVDDRLPNTEKEVLLKIENQHELVMGSYDNEFKWSWMGNILYWLDVPNIPSPSQDN